MKKIEAKTSDDISSMHNNFIHNAAVPNPINTGQEETHRTQYRRERDRILYSGGFRRLQDKTQVIAATKSGDHRTRLTHTLEVEQIATSVSDALGLNRDLASAIAYGHDIGHTPFGHAAERALNDLLKDYGGFSHAIQSVRFIKEKDIKVSNIVLEGILKHDTDV
ncbi:MAG: HD domain-containing protein, partial [Bacteroidales bacterium]|nr:HD domain-containing protein [Bacteroidales bacterium]